ncbi:restriction endonuclease [Moraxella caviae]|uniref:Restriction endonuclease n=1 Tax=Moraxella caviae TaxID=34060 RepID=A0A1T0A858_9GAMM|nr:Uma2 family endonuclease [Moraxella caviae]OOR91887.1 restriction endonuclease [Moraxella caviae]STZ09739.1 Uncharacterized protein conserved in cyanobacteria [Moraxella caviae]VEW11222.1 Uncharacterized protein conserved in cyanobacteria [Moraxella caviae]
MITQLSQLDLNKRYTYADYLSWQIKEGIELIYGKITAMSPAPVRLHQKISMVLSAKLYQHLEGLACDVYTAPFDVRLLIDDSESVVQPDICVVCDTTKLTERGCDGAPDIVVEILSPSNSKKEMGVKFNLYQDAGVREYWIIDPTYKTVLMYVLQNGKFVGLKPFVSGETIRSTVLPEFCLALDKLFDD